ncbi:uncharacterized protein JN550_002222 [Neoarthrinium moseri]|uniref:uncharacterized protein n=1 Tax=Neoarthrinium moseri TaxID=1658444 RepID=UPI001FDBD3C5|nr:uncharacterized protein JN550_002222 [Neoarthrinium moseri]KAI1874793.1 hypothetical protein JN550_002222 [Neoarthrinium moseri]
MPKVDATRNYYAELSLPPSASADDIKKQYRKLAMQWHPDRNRGREEEASKKFQIIQSAFEILTDPTQKREYDTARNKTSARFSGSSGVRGNPWANAGAEWAPPPKRAGPTAAGAKTQPRPTPGAARYSNWGTGAARPGNASQKESPTSAKAHYEAWNNMRSSSQRKPPPTPGRAPTSAARDSRPQSRTSDSEGIPRTTSQQQKAKASFGNTTRRAGYTPRSPGLGDEPPVKNNNYFTTRSHTNIFNEASASDARQNQRASAAPDPLAQFRDKPMDDRQSTPYTTPGGEKTSLFDEGANLGRSRSTRASARKSGVDASGTFPFPQQRSSSTPRTSSSNDGGSEDSTRVNTGTDGPSRRTSTNHKPSTRASDRYRPKSAESTTATAGHASSAAAGASASASNGTESQQPGDSSTYATLPTISSPEPYPTKPLNSAKFQSVNAAAYAAMLKVPTRSSAPSVAARKGHSNLYPFEKVLKKNMSSLVEKKCGSTPVKSTEKGVNKHHKINFVSKCDRLGYDTDSDTPNSFAFDSNQSAAGQKRFASSSADNINTQFVNDENLESSWEFKAGGVSPDDAPTPSAKLRSQSGSRLGRRSPTKINRRPVPPRPEAGQGSEDTTKAGFSAEDWGEKIGSEHFFPQPTPSASASPTRRTNSRKNSKPVKVTRGGSAGIVDEDDEIPTATRGWQDEPKPAGAQSPMAMDIDTPPVEKNDDTPKVSQPNGVRNIHVEPSRPEWRAGDLNGNPPPQPPRPTLNTDASAGVPFVGNPVIQSKSAPSTANPYANLNGGSEDSEEFRTTFSDFKNVEPLADPKPTGLQSFADLKTTLPFESQPSSTVPLDKVHPVPPLAFPIAPTAPRLPPTMAITGIRPSAGQWRKYAQEFYVYMEKWESFNQKVLDHFAARQKQMITRRQQHGRVWLDAMQGKDGASVYLADLEQDHDVRKQWARACDDHQARIREFMAFRDRVK